MDLIADLHTHTIASRHAYSTLLENVSKAAKARLSVLGITDHAPGMPNTTNNAYFFNVKVWPRELFGIHILRGAEVNIMDKTGAIDLSDEVLERLDYVIASFHVGIFPFSTDEEHTNAVIAAMANPKVCVIGHPDDSRFPLDYNKLAKAAKFHNKALELNESSLSDRTNREDCEKNIIQLLEACKRESTWIMVNSDSHIALDIGFFSRALYMLEKCSFPSSLVVNSSASRLSSFFSQSISLDLDFKGLKTSG